MPTIYLNHAVPGGLDAPAPWNNVDFQEGGFTGLYADNLTDENGDPTGVDYYVDTPIGSRADRSHNPGTAHGWPNNVWESLWTPNADNGTLTRFTGLPAGATFSLKTAGWDNRDSRHTDFTVAEADAPTTIQYVQESGTPPAPVEFTGTVPANGEITVLCALGTAVSGYWNAIELTWTESGGDTDILIDHASFPASGLAFVASLSFLREMAFASYNVTATAFIASLGFARTLTHATTTTMGNAFSVALATVVQATKATLTLTAREFTLLLASAIVIEKSVLTLQAQAFTVSKVVSFLLERATFRLRGVRVMVQYAGRLVGKAVQRIRIGIGIGV